MKPIAQDYLQKEYVTKQRSLEAIAKELSCSRGNVKNYLIKYGIPRRTNGPIPPDVTGQTFGKWTALRYSEHRGSIAYWFCECQCGATKEVNINYVRSGRSLSCLNCSRRRGYNDLSLEYFRHIKIRAAKKKRDCTITPEYLWQLFEDQGRKCALSGVSIKLEPGYNRSQTASLDRIDSTKGYIEGNVQWLHKQVNEMKMAQSQKEFLDWCLKISEYKR